MPRSSNSVQLHRVLRAPASRIYQAFLNPDALCRWLPPRGYIGKIDRFDRFNPQQGDSFHMTFTAFANGHSHSFTSYFVELVPYKKIRLCDEFDDQALTGKMSKTITLRSVKCGTELRILHEGLPQAIPAEKCYLGWQESLLQLADLVEPDFSQAD
ncbi:SRPBCC family protein [Thalassoglobus sp. JC818]|uniref:SRPBCC family protein n=1 Tax=Thalassoglobus sp. JC818 TaxID=3232136 RepID=UPI0034576D2C